MNGAATGLDWLGVDLRLREPAAEPQGALILDHGRGADENDLFGLLDELDPERRLLGVTTGGPWSGIAPGGRHWYVVERVGYPHPETFTRGYEALGDALDALLAERGIDWSAAAIGGFSQGTVMSYALGLGAGRPVPAAILANSGFIPEVEGWEADLDRSTLIQINHGAADPVISVDFARRDRERLVAAGLEPGYLETPAGHWLPAEAVAGMRDALASAIPGLGTLAG